MPTDSPVAAQVPPNAAPDKAAPVVDDKTKTPAAATPPVAAAAPVVAPVTTDAAAKPGASTEEKPAAQAKVELVRDDLKLPEGSLLDPKTVDGILAFAKERGLSKEAAQGVLDRENQSVLSYVEGEKAKLTQTQESWFDASKNDKEIGGEAFARKAELSKRVVDKFGSPALTKMLIDSRMGNHPEVVRVFSRIGETMTEDQLVIAGGAAAEGSSMADRLYAPKQQEGKGE